MGAFIIHGEWVKLSLHDVYFMIGLPQLGVICETQPLHPRDVDMEDILAHHSMDGA